MTIGDILRSGFLSKAVGNNRENQRDDVLRVKSKLSENGMFDFFTSPEPHEYITEKMDGAIKTFQKEKGMKVDGFLLPDGETEKALFGEQALPKQKNNCQNLETAYVNAEALFYIVKQKLKRAEDKKMELEKELSLENEKFSEANSTIRKETEDKIIAKSKGAVAGGAIGALIGARAGTGASMALAQLGMGVGSNTGRIIEELGDAIDTNSETDFTLGTKKHKISDTLKEIQDKISDQLSVIEAFTLEVNDARQKTEDAKAAWSACKVEK